MRWNLELMKKVKKAIEADNGTFDMDKWYGPANDGDYLPPLSPDQEPLCGTTLCLAGWAAHLDGWSLMGDGETAIRKGEETSIERAARRALGITEEEAEVFYATEEAALATLERWIAGAEMQERMLKGD